MAAIHRDSSATHFDNLCKNSLYLQKKTKMYMDNN